MREYLCIAMLLVMIILLIPACGPSEAAASQAAEPRPLSFVVDNRSGGEITSIGLEGANLPMSFGDMSKGQTKSLKNKKLQLPEKLTLHWSDARGKRKEGSVKVWGELGATYSGPVKLTITQRGKASLSGG